MRDVLSLHAPTRSAVGFGLERLPGHRRIPPGNDVGFTPRSRERLQVRFRWTGGSPASIHGVVGGPAYWMELGAIGGEARRSVRLGKPVEDASGSTRLRLCPGESRVSSDGAH